MGSCNRLNAGVIAGVLAGCGLAWSAMPAPAAEVGYNSKSTVLPDGRRQTEVHSKWINYLDESGQWRPIDPRFVVTDRGFEMTEAPFEVIAPSHADGAAMFINNNRYDPNERRVIDDEPLGQWIYPIAAAHVAGRLEASDLGWGTVQYIVYPGAYPEYDADLIYWVHDGVAPRLNKFIRFNRAIECDAIFQFKVTFSDDVETTVGNRNVSVRKAGARGPRGGGMSSFYMWDSSMGWQGRESIRFEFEPADGPRAFMLTKHIPAAFFTTAVFPVFCDTDTTFMPAAGNSAPIDGLIYRDNVNEPWLSIRNGNGTTNNPTNQADNMVAIYSHASAANNWQVLARSFFGFDTSSIPDADEISAATFSTYVVSKQNQFSYDHGIRLVKATVASPNALPASDYQGTVGNTVARAADILLSALPTGQRYNWTLNAAGLADINKTGYTFFGGRFVSDADNVQPSWENGGREASFVIRYADFAGTADDPTLVVTHGAPPTVTAINPTSGDNDAPVNITSVSGSNFAGPPNTHAIQLVRASGQYLSISDGSQNGLDMVGTDFTIEAWVNFAAFPTSGDVRGIAGKRNGLSPNRAYMTWLRNTGTDLRFGIQTSPNGNNGSETLSSPQNLSLGTWYHFAVTYTAGSGAIEFFLNGAGIGTGTGESSIYDSSAPFTVGFLGDDDLGYLDGAVDDVRVWRVKRTASEIAGNRLVQLTGSESNLQAYWRLNNDYADASGHGNSLSPVNNPAFSTTVPFTLSPVVKLTKAGESDVTCSGFSFTASDTLSNGTCDITGVATGTWNVVVTNPDGFSGMLADGFTVELPCIPPSITLDPVGQSVCAGQPATFTASGDGTGLLTYQWRKDGDPLSGETSTTYSIASAQTIDEGSYTLVVSNACGSATSAPASLTVESADGDSDGTPDCSDGCPSDAAKTSPGDCGCGETESDSDSDGTPDCHDVSRMLHFQGKLRDANGVAVSGSHDLIFRVYDAPTGGVPSFAEAVDEVPVLFGLFNVLIGAQTAGGVPDGALERAEIYISVEVDGGGELSPRSRVPATGYAIKSKAAEQLVRPGTLNPAVTVDSTGQIGVGTKTPGHPIDTATGAYLSDGGAWVNASSRELKRDVAALTAEQAAAALADLEPVTFRYAAAPGDLRVGFIAEDVPELVAEENRRGLAAMDVVAVLTRVLHEQQAAIADLRRQAAADRERIEKQQRDLEELREQVAGAGKN